MGKKDKNKVVNAQGELPLETPTEDKKNPVAERAENARKASMMAQAKAQAEQEAKQEDEEKRLKKAEEQRNEKKADKKQEEQDAYNKALEEARVDANQKLEHKEDLKLIGNGGGLFGGLSGLLTKADTLTAEEKQKLNEQAEREQGKDVSKLKDETGALEKENVEENKNSAENQIKAMEDLLKKHIDLMDNSSIYNELPRTIRQAYKSGKFGEVMTDDLRNQFRAEMKKPESERDKDILEKYKNAKDAQHARNYYILDAIGSGLINVGSALQGGQGGKETKWNQLQGSRIADAQQRYKNLLDTKANEVIKSAENAGIMNRENEKALRTLYQDRRLQPLLNKLDVDTQTQLLRLIDQKAGALSFETFINALALQLMNDPKGAVSGVFGAVDKLK